MKRALIILMVLWGWELRSQDPVEPYLLIAAEHNPGLKSRFNLYLAQLEKIPQVKALPDPQVAFGFFIQPVETRVGAQKASVNLSQSFPWFGTLQSQADMNSRMAESLLAGFQKEKLKLFREVRLAYNRLYYLNKAIVLTEENLQVLASFKELARVNFESGKTGFVNVLRVEMEEEELKVVLSSLQDRQVAALVEFENLLNARLPEAVDFPQVLPTHTLDASEQQLLDSLKATNAELQVLEHQALAKGDELKLAELMAKPSFRVSASYINISERSDVEISGNGQDAWLFPQVGLNIPLAGKKYRAQQKQAQLERESIQFKIEDQANLFSTQLQHRLKDHADAQRKLTLYERLYDLAERSLSLLQTEFATGKTDFEEVLRMQVKLLDYQLQLEKARVDINNSIYKINYLVGK